MTTQAEISVESCVKWLEGYKRNMTWSGPLREHDEAIVDAAIAHLRRLQEVDDYKEKYLLLSAQYVRETDELEAELEKCRRDAERYRWLRDNKLRGIEDGKFIALSRFYGLDEAIDAAISAGEGKDEMS